MCARFADAVTPALQHKLAMCRAAVESHELVRVSSWEIGKGMVNYPAVVHHIESIVGPAVRVLYVCGEYCDSVQ